MFELNLSLADDIDPAEVPDFDTLHRWVSNALSGHRDRAVIDMRVVGESEMRDLNRTYRNRDQPTNILSFPADAPPGIGLPMLGDIAICAPVVQREANQQNKSLEHHWAHLVTHGVLHLLGYDHIKEADAEAMEATERRILARLGIQDPYEA